MGDSMQNGHMIEEAAPGDDDWADAEDWEEFDEDEDLNEDQIRVRDAIAAAERSPEDGVPELLILLLDTDLDADPYEHRINVMRTMWRIGGGAAAITWWLLEHAGQWYELPNLYLTGGADGQTRESATAEDERDGWRYLIRASKLEEGLRFDAAEALLAESSSARDQQLVRSLVLEKPHDLMLRMNDDNQAPSRVAVCAVADRSLSFSLRFDLADAIINQDLVGGLTVIAKLLAEPERTPSQLRALLEIQTRHLAARLAEHEDGDV